MIKKILTYPEDKDILTQISEQTSIEDCKELIQDLKDTLKNTSDGVGISAIQIGVPKRVCYINYRGKEYVMINPVITWKRSGANGIKKFREGCLSVPDRYVEIPRAQKVICEYTDENGNIKTVGEGG